MPLVPQGHADNPGHRGVFLPGHVRAYGMLRASSPLITPHTLPQTLAHPLVYSYPITPNIMHP